MLVTTLTYANSVDNAIASTAAIAWMITCIVAAGIAATATSIAVVSTAVVANYIATAIN